MLDKEDNVVHNRHRARQLLKLGQYELALEDAEIAIQREKEEWSSWSAKAHALLGLNRQDEALEILS